MRRTLFQRKVQGTDAGWLIATHHQNEEASEQKKFVESLWPEWIIVFHNVMWIRGCNTNYGRNTDIFLTWFLCNTSTMFFHTSRLTKKWTIIEPHMCSYVDQKCIREMPRNTTSQMPRHPSKGYNAKLIQILWSRGGSILKLSLVASFCDFYRLLPLKQRL